MAQPQPQMPQRQFSPPQASPSPAPVGAQPAYPMPPNKRPKVSPQPQSQPQSPYAQSPYAASPGAPVTPNAAGNSAPSPTLPVAQSNGPQSNGQPVNNGTYTTPYTNGSNGNGSTTPSIALPESRPTPPPQPIFAAPPAQVHSPAPPILPQTSTPANAQYTNATFGAPPINPSMHPQTPQHPQHQALAPHPTPGVMGPPSRLPDRPQKDDYDPTDLMAGTGIDVRAEEAYLANMFAVDASVPESKNGFSIHQSGSKASFYGASIANQPAEPHGGKSQDQFAAEAAEKAWQESARFLASERAVEIKNAFLQVPIVQMRAEQAAKEHGLTLNWDMKAAQPMGRMKVMEEHPRPVKVETKTTPDGAIVRTSGCWIPHDAYLADQLALLSIATKQRIRDLVTDSKRIAVIRQTSSHGEVPEEWREAAAPPNVAVTVQPDDVKEEGAPVDGDGNIRKRSADPEVLADVAPPPKIQKIPANTASSMSGMMRDLGRSERDNEELRLRKRQARREGKDVSSLSRSTSVAPGTPGGSAPDGEKAMTKKEQKKLEAARKAEANSHANQNLTSGKFLGTKPGGLFGKKSYSWMTGGGSGANTPKSSGLAGKTGSTPAPGTPAAPTQSVLTVEGSASRRPGAWREDKDKGKNIQLRDWIMALEGDGIEIQALQRAYNDLDTSGPKQ